MVCVSLLANASIVPQMASSSLSSAFFTINSFLIPLVDDTESRLVIVNNVTHEGKNEQAHVACEKLSKR